MAVILPSGEKDFSGGGSDPMLCGEPQDCDNPPCGDVSPLILGKSGDFSCTEEALIVTVSVTGGVPPFTWATTNGLITVTAARTITLSIGSAIDKSRAVVIGGHPDCIGNFYAYIDRGIGIKSDDGVSACLLAQCALAFYNCFDELVRVDGFGSTGEYTIGTENDVGNPCKVWDDVDAVGNTSFMGTIPNTIDYSHCDRWPTGYGAILCFYNPNTATNLPNPACSGVGGCGSPQGQFERRSYSGGGCVTITDDPYGSPSNPAGFQELGFYLINHESAAINRCDVRHADLLEQGCAPCKLLTGVEIVVTVTDALGNSTTIVIPVS